ncbi:tetratricopeptide repeat protein, partial [Chryseobacterium sp.]|uniref:tetratricopeptide repeat protein n=2 Tax=Chryseobacterium TaxID=59732 RepID=UPI0024E1EBB2
MIRSLLFMVLIILFSCNQRARQQDEKNFDTTLWKKNEQFRLSGDYDSLLSLNTRYYRKADQMGYEDGKALCYINIAELNITLVNYQKTRVLFDKAREILENSQNNLHKAKFYIMYGHFNSTLTKPDKAFEDYNEALNNLSKSDDSPLKDKLLFDLYIELGSYFALKKDYGKGLKLFQKAQKLDDTGFAECIIGDYIYMYRNQDSAYKYIATAYHKTNISGKKDKIALYANTMMGEWYKAEEQYDEAEEMLLQALEIDKKTRRIHANYSKYIYNDLRMVYERKGDREKAYFYLNAYNDAMSKTNTAIYTTINQDMESFI